MPLRDVIMDDDGAAACHRRVTGLLSAVRAIAEFPRKEILANSHALEIARDHLSRILDKAEGK